MDVLNELSKDVGFKLLDDQGLVVILRMGVGLYFKRN